MIPLVEQLAETWSSIDGLCDSLSEEQWHRPTGCPGWSVQDQVAHLVDFETFTLGRPRPDHVVADLAHVKNDMGAHNEVGVDFRRADSGPEVLAELREVAAERLGILGSLTEAQLDDATQTPIGPGTVRDLLTMRIMDTWSHEQDIRRALGRPGHDHGPVMQTAVGYWVELLPYVVGKRAAAPEGSTTVFLIGDLPPAAVTVEGGRARLLESVPSEPTVTLRTVPVEFAALVGGRSDARPQDVDVVGDIDLGRHIATHLGFMP